MTNSRREFLKKTVIAGGGSAVMGQVPVASADDPTDDVVPADDSNYDSAARGSADIDWIVIHATAGTYESTVHVFGDPDTNASAHYVVRNQEGYITRMVDDSDVAWHAGNREYNRRSIGIEFENADPQLRNQFSTSLYRAGARLVTHLAAAYDIPFERVVGDVGPCHASNGAGLIEHAQVPHPSDCSSGGGVSGHWDPGPNWKWSTLLTHLDDPSGDGSGHPSGGSGGGSGGGSDGGGHPSGLRISVGDHVRSTVNLNTRRLPGLDGRVVHTMPTGANATVIDGPVRTDGYVWWYLEWRDHGVSGWSVQNYLDIDRGASGGGGTAGETGRFSMGEEVRSTADLNTRANPGLGSTVVYTAPGGTRAKVVDGPVEADGYTWWGLYWPDRDIHGWSVERYLEPDSDGGSGHPTGSRISVGDLVESTVDLNTRQGPSLQHGVVDTMSPGTLGEVIDGPERADGYTWWALDWLAHDLQGWSVQQYLEVSDDTHHPSEGTGGNSDEGSTRNNVQGADGWGFSKETNDWIKETGTAVKVLEGAQMDADWSDEPVYSVPIQYNQYGAGDDKTFNGPGGIPVSDGNLDLTWEHTPNEDNGRAGRTLPENRGRNMEVWANGEGWNASTADTIDSSGTIYRLNDLLNGILFAGSFLGGPAGSAIAWASRAKWVGEEITGFGDGKESLVFGNSTYVEYSYKEGGTGLLIFANIPQGDYVEFTLDSRIVWGDLTELKRTVRFGVTPYATDDIQTTFESDDPSYEQIRM